MSNHSKDRPEMTYQPHWDEYDVANTTAEYRARWDAVAAELSDFDCSLIDESIAKGWTVEETVAQGREDLAERDEDARLERIHGDRADFDMSMNY